MEIATGSGATTEVRRPTARHGAEARDRAMHLLHSVVVVDQLGEGQRAHFLTRHRAALARLTSRRPPFVASGSLS